MPTKIKMNSPSVTAGGGEIVKKTNAWSAGAVMKMSAAPITAKTPANFVLRSHSKTSPASGINNPTIMKNPANARVRISGERVSTPNGVNRKPKMKPIPNKTAKARIALVKGVFVECDLYNFILYLYISLKNNIFTDLKIRGSQLPSNSSNYKVNLYLYKI
jgi:hypothetical protein